MRYWQAVALATYRNPIVNSFLQTRLGSAIFALCYDFYKDALEVPGNGGLARQIGPGKWVIDVGANIGFFTERLARWVRDGGRVIAIEPDRKNADQLRRRLARRNLNVVDIFQGAATARDGPVWLLTNPDHPGDHRLAAGVDDKLKGSMVDGLTIDTLVERAGNPDVCFIKIDTQGAEGQVLDGAVETLRRCWPSLFIELDDLALRRYETTAFEMLDRLSANQYRLFRLSRSGREIAITPQQVSDLLLSEKAGYLDLLCVHASGAHDLAY